MKANTSLGQELWTDTDRAAVLLKHGYKRDMLGNRMGLFAESETVAQIQALPDGHLLKAAVLDKDSGFDAVWHKGGPT